MNDKSSFVNKDSLHKHNECRRNIIGIGADSGFNAQYVTNKTLTTDPFGNTYEENGVSPEVEVGVVAGLRCMKP